MRFNLGPVPEQDDFSPKEEGYVSIREPTPAMMQLWAIPVILVVVAALLAALLLLSPVRIMEVDPWQALVIFIVLIPAHELIHAAAHPGNGMTPDTVVGIWPGRLVFYAHYHGAMPRSRFLLILGLPFFALSIIPALLAIALQIEWPGLMVLAVTNGAAASGDLLGVGLVLLQIPGGAKIRNKGWRSYWRATAVQAPSTDRGGRGRRLLRIGVIGGGAAAAGLALQPVNSTVIRVALLSSLAVALPCALLLLRSAKARLALGALALVPALGLALPGRPHEVSALRRAYVDALPGYEGTRFVWGGEGRFGVDCSGLVRRAMINAALEQGVVTLNPRLLRIAADLWWHDTSARALGAGHRGVARRLFSAPDLNGLDHARIRPGDLAVTADGIHVMAYLGGRRWIEADPDRGEVIRQRLPSRLIWFKVKVHLVRWKVLELTVTH